MTIRKISSPYSYITKTIIVTIIGMIIIGQIIHQGNKQVRVTTNTQAVYAPDGIQLYARMQATGDIQTQSNFPIYTHTMTLANQSYIGLRSSSINLNYFSGTYEIGGHIHHINRGLPSIDIMRMRDPSRQLFIQDNIYTYFDELIVIDLENIPNIHSKHIDQRIIILSDNTPVISIKHIYCQEKDCSNYKDIQEESERFTSDPGHTYYKKEIGQWIITHPNDRVYIIEGDDEDVIIFSASIELLDGKYIIDRYAQEIFDACNELENIQEANISQKTGNIITLTAQGTNQTNQSVGCEISVDMRNNIGIKNVSLF